MSTEQTFEGYEAKLAEALQGYVSEGKGETAQQLLLTLAKIGEPTGEARQQAINQIVIIQYYREKQLENEMFAVLNKLSVTQEELQLAAEYVAQKFGEQNNG